MKLLILICLSFYAQLVRANPYLANYCDQWMLNFGEAKNLQPALNVEKVYKTLESWRAVKYKNEIQIKIIGKAEGENIIRLDLPSPNPSAKKILITAGVHGNEPFGVTALIEFMEKTIYNRSLRQEFEFVFLPMLNPAGLKLNTRLTANKMDLNRSFAPGDELQASQLIKANLKDESFELAIDLHGSTIREGFFIIQSKSADISLSEETLKNFDQNFLFKSADDTYPSIIPSITDKNKPSYFLLAPGLANSYNTGTLKDFMAKNLKVKNAFTFEYPGQISSFDRQSEYLKLIEKMIHAVATP